MPDNASAPATGAAAGATPAQTPPATPAAATTPAPAPSATDGADALGDPGKQALDRMKAERDDAVKAAKAAKTALETLQSSTASDTDKALAAARAEGAAEVAGKLHGAIRRSEVKVALARAGINPAILDLAVNASEFAGLTVTEDGEIEKLAETVAMFKGTHGDLFKVLPTSGSADLGTGSSGRSAAGKTFTREQLRDPEFYQTNKADIMAAMKEGRITG